MKLLLLGLVVFGSLSAPAAPAAPAAPVAPAVFIDKEITKLLALYSDGFGYNSPKARHVVFGSLFDTGRQDAVAFFRTVEMDLSNVHFEYIAIFSQGQGRDLSDVGGPTERPYHLVATAMIGSRWTRTLAWETAKISKGRVVVQGKRWAEKDAGCCPTQPIEVTFSIFTGIAGGAGPHDYPVLTESEGAGHADPPTPPRKAGKRG
ncbi:MAG: hypothetical protein WCP29_12860 [Acidobacteriota bacterium]